MKITIRNDNGTLVYEGDFRAVGFELHRDAIPRGDGVFDPGPPKMKLELCGDEAVLAVLPTVQSEMHNQPSPIPTSKQECSHDWRERKYGRWCAKCGHEERCQIGRAHV